MQFRTFSYFKVSATHHKVSATTEDLSRDTTERTAGVFRIQNITEKKKQKRK